MGLRHLDSRNALAALESLYKGTDSIAYRNSLQPQNGKYIGRKLIAAFVVTARYIIRES